MSRPNKPWFRKSNKRWYVWFNGKQLHLGPDRKEAHQRFFELMAQPEPERQAPQTGAISLPELTDRFLDWVQRNRAPDTYEWYRYRLERFCQKYPDMSAERLKPFHVEEWVSDYDMKDTSRRNYFRSVKRCYRWGRKQGYLSTNPIADLEMPRAEHREMALSKTDFDQLTACVRSSEFADLVEVTWQTGCRPQESLIVEAHHVDVPNQRWVFRTSESKGKKVTRVVYLTDPAMDIVQRLMQQHPDGPLFRNTSGRPWTTESVSCAFGAIQMRMGQAEMKQQSIAISDGEIAKLTPKLKPRRKTGGSVVDKTPAELRAEAKRKLTQKKVKELAPRYSLYALRHSYATNALVDGGEKV